jgi:Zn-dependent M28 family amino/carboxypeptidase
MGKYKLLIPLAGLAFGLVASPERLSAATPLEYLGQFCAFGERVPGSPAHRRAMRYIAAQLKAAEIDSFDHRGIRYFNLCRRYAGEGPAVGFGVHWDSYPGCPGANDGGSGVALLLKLADTLDRTPPGRPVHLFFFDGKDVNQAECLGSNHFAGACVDRYSYVLILDMVGDRDLTLYKEGNSYQFFPALVDSLWAIGEAAAPACFRPAVKYYITDDHIPLIKYGIRAVDVIDFDYAPFWHTADDTIDKCSAESLDAVFLFLLALAYGAEG